MKMIIQQQMKNKRYNLLALMTCSLCVVLWRIHTSSSVGKQCILCRQAFSLPMYCVNGHLKLL